MEVAIVSATPQECNTVLSSNPEVIMTTSELKMSQDDTMQKEQKSMRVTGYR